MPCTRSPTRSNTFASVAMGEGRRYKETFTEPNDGFSESTSTDNRPHCTDPHGNQSIALTAVVDTVAVCACSFSEAVVEPHAASNSEPVHSTTPNRRAPWRCLSFFGGEILDRIRNHKRTTKVCHSVELWSLCTGNWHQEYGLFAFSDQFAVAIQLHCSARRS